MAEEESEGVYYRSCLTAVVYAPDHDTAVMIFHSVACDVNASGSPDTIVEFGPDADIAGPRDYLHVGPIGSENRHITLYRTVGGGHRVMCGCWWPNDDDLRGGTIDEFAERVKQVYGDDDPENFQNKIYYDQYMAFIAMARSRIDEWEQ